jgi:hypothetical protein
LDDPEGQDWAVVSVLAIQMVEIAAYGLAQSFLGVAVVGLADGVLVTDAQLVKVLLVGAGPPDGCLCGRGM